MKTGRSKTGKNARSERSDSDKVFESIDQSRKKEVSPSHPSLFCKKVIFNTLRKHSSVFEINIREIEKGCWTLEDV